MTKAAAKPKQAKKKWKVRTIVHAPYHGKIDMKLADQVLEEIIAKREQRERKTRTA